MDLPRDIPEGLHPALRWLVRQALATLEERGELSPQEIADHVAALQERILLHQQTLEAMGDEGTGVEESLQKAGEHHLAGSQLIVAALEHGDPALLHEAEKELLLGQAHLSVGAERSATLSESVRLDVQF